MENNSEFLQFVPTYYTVRDTKPLKLWYFFCLAVFLCASGHNGLHIIRSALCDSPRYQGIVSAWGTWAAEARSVRTVSHHHMEKRCCEVTFCVLLKHLEVKYKHVNKAI